MQLVLIFYFAVASLTLFNAPITVNAQGDASCTDQMGISADQQDKLKNLKKYYCISQCMGGFGGEVDFCKSDGICLNQPSASAGYSSAMNTPRT